MSFERWWRRVLQIGGAVGHVIAFGIGAKILLAAIHDPAQKPWLYLVALTLMGAGAYPLQRIMEVVSQLATLISSPPVVKPPADSERESDRRSPGSSEDGSQ